MYVEQGATFIRPDAIAYLWKESDILHPFATDSPVIQFLRAALNDLAPHVQ